MSQAWRFGACVASSALSHRRYHAAPSWCEEDRDQDTGDDGQAHLVFNGDGALTPRLGLGEVVLPDIETLFLFPALGVEEGHNTGLEIEIVGEEFHGTPAAGLELDDPPQERGTGERDLQVADNAGVDGMLGEGQAFGGVHVQVALHTGDHRAGECAFFSIPEAGIDKGAINQPECIALASEGLRPLVIVAQQERFVAATDLDVDILGDP